MLRTFRVGLAVHVFDNEDLAHLSKHHSQGTLLEDAMASKTLDQAEIKQKLSQRVMKETPRKRLRAPPNAAIKEAIG